MHNQPFVSPDLQPPMTPLPHSPLASIGGFEPSEHDVWDPTANYSSVFSKIPPKKIVFRKSLVVPCV